MEEELYTYNTQKLGLVSLTPQHATFSSSLLTLIVSVLVDMFDTTSVEGRRTTDDTMDFIAFLQQEFRQVGPILAGDT